MVKYGLQSQQAGKFPPVLLLCHMILLLLLTHMQTSITAEIQCGIKSPSPITQCSEIQAAVTAPHILSALFPSPPMTFLCLL
jgi:hypothetical protein